MLRKQNAAFARALIDKTRKFIVPLFALVTLLALLAGVSPVAARGGRPLSTALTGAAEVPGPGDPDGSGKATLTLNQGQGEICFKITVSNITLPATGAHIHEAPAGAAGSIVVFLTPPDASGSSSGCVSVARALVKEIRKHPSGFYVNVHNANFPAGAVRGQLSK